MPIREREQVNVPLPTPFPEGWYFVASRQSLNKAKLIKRKWMGEDIVVWSDENGTVCIAEAYCPHLGADLGPGAGGQVREGQLVCPFHGFEFDASGQCVVNPLGPPPKAARLRVFETRDFAGLIFAWWGLGGRPPQWHLPDEVPEQHGWSKLHIWTPRFPGHPQETTENSVDLAHLSHVHGYYNVSRVEPLEVDGHFLRSRFDFGTTRKFAKVGRLKLDVAADALIYGLGYSQVEVHERTTGLNMRLWVLATPLDGTFIDLAVVTQTGPIRNPRGKIAVLALLPPRMRPNVLNKLQAYYEKRDVLQDIPLWSAKQYRSHPRLSRADGEIMKYRSYCKQFYPGPLTVVENAEKVAK